MANESGAKVLIVDDDRATTSWLRALLEPEGHQVTIARTGAEALELVRTDPPRLILHELVLPDIDGLDFCRSLRLVPQIENAWIIIMSARSGREDIAAGLTAGADDFIPKRRGADSELLAKSKMLLMRHRTEYRPPEQTGRGSIVSFFSAKGGSGTTTLALNTTFAIPKFSPGASTLLVDMVFPLGAVGYMLGTKSTLSVAKLTHEQLNTLDRQAIAQEITEGCQYGIRSLISANDLQEAQGMEVSRIVPLIGTLRSMFDLTVVDIGHSLSRITLPILETSDLIYVIVIPDVTGVALTKLALDYLLSRRIPPERFILIQNRTVPRSWLSREDIERELNMPVAITIPYDGEQVTLATNARVPYLERYENTPVAVTLRELGKLAVERTSRKDDAVAVPSM